MAGLVPAIHVFLSSSEKDVDARNKCGHDGLDGRVINRFIDSAMIVTTGLDPVVHGDIRRMRRHGKTERAGSLHGLPDQVRQ
jgi:hypothetical protein